MPPDQSAVSGAEPDEEELLLWLHMGTPDERAKARRVLTKSYLCPLVNLLRGWLGPVPDVAVIAKSAAGEALVRLFEKVEADLGAVDPENRGIWRLLIKISKDKAKDYRKWLRRHQPPPQPDDPPAEVDPHSHDPEKVAIGNELLGRLMLFANTIEEPANRFIFINDLFGERGSLQKKEKTAHDQELVVGLEEHGVYSLTSGALRKRRERIREALEAFLGLNGGGGE